MDLEEGLDKKAKDQKLFEIQTPIVVILDKLGKMVGEQRNLDDEDVLYKYLNIKEEDMSDC